jgi:hypothetical protein
MFYACGQMLTIEIKRKGKSFKLARLFWQVNVRKTTGLLGLRPHDIPVLIACIFLSRWGTQTENIGEWKSSCIQDGCGVAVSHTVSHTLY